MRSGVRRFYEFGCFRLDAQMHRLMSNGEFVPVYQKAVEALEVLVRNRGEVLEREFLIQAVWPDTSVEDANLTVAISQLRKVLSQRGEGTEFIETIPKVGYRFVGDVREVVEQAAPLVVEKRILSEIVIEEELLHETPREYSARSAIPSWLIKSVELIADRKAAPVIIFAALVLAVGAILELKKRDGHTNIVSAAPLGAITSIAVLPPRLLKDEPDGTAFTLGIADALITRLGAVHKLAVRPTSAIFAYADRNSDPLNAGRALNVEAVLDGSVQRADGTVRVSLRLLKVADGSQMWAGNFEETDTDVFKIQDQISQQVAGALFPNLTQNESALLQKQQTTNPEAYAQYLKGNYFWSKRGTEASKSAEYFRKAIELDPNFTQAYIGLANLDATGLMPSPEAEVLIDRALQLDPSSSDAHATKAFIKMFHHWDWSTAESELNQAIELNPNSATAHHWKGVYLSIRGRINEAKAEMYRALELDPLSPIILADIGQLHYFARDYDEALDYCNRALVLDPQFYDAHTYLVDIYHLKHMNREALGELIKVRYPNDARAGQRLTEIFVSDGYSAALQLENETFLNLNYEQRTSNALFVARMYCRLGDSERALRWLDIAVNKPASFATVYLAVDPLYDGVRSDPRFTTILDKIGLGTDGKSLNSQARSW